MEINKIHHIDAKEGYKLLDDNSVNTIITSPPYYNLRDYGFDDQLGLESTPEIYVNNLVSIFRSLKPKLKDDGTLWLNLGDSYSSGGNGGNEKISKTATQSRVRGYKKPPEGLKPKDLIGIPWMVAFALRADGWYLRQDIIWCLSGGTWLYTKTQKGEMPMTIKDIYRLNPNTVQLWNGKKWTQLLGMNKNIRKGNELEIVLRSGERISCTPTHKWPTENGLKIASKLQIGDILQSCLLPDSKCNYSAIDNDAAWLCGLYIAEGSRSNDCIQIAGHSKEIYRLSKLIEIAKKYDGYITHTIDGNKQSIRLYGKILNAIIDTFVSGKTAKDKCFNPIVWRKNNMFISSMLNGYLSGDGHWDKKNNRWRLGFTRNYNLERDIRTACARLGYKLKLNMSTVKYKDKDLPTFKGEIRMKVSNHLNNNSPNEIVEIRKSRCRYVYDLGVEDDPHLFSLASGVLTHNSKPNPMPESVKDRCTKSHEYIFLLSKSKKYYYDYEAIQEIATGYDGRKDTKFKGGVKYQGFNQQTMLSRGHERWKKRGFKQKDNDIDNPQHHGNDIITNYDDSSEEFVRNKRSVWKVNTKPFSETHFATYPEALIKDCVLAGCPAGGLVLDPFSGAATTALVAKKYGRNYLGFELNQDYINIGNNRLIKELGIFYHHPMK